MRKIWILRRKNLATFSINTLNPCQKPLCFPNRNFSLQKRSRLRISSRTLRRKSSLGSTPRTIGSARHHQVTQTSPNPINRTGPDFQCPKADLFYPGNHQRDLRQLPTNKPRPPRRQRQHSLPPRPIQHSKKNRHRLRLSLRHAFQRWRWK